ncbi:hypothetical protein N7931_05750 [Catenovulum sp. 2E275]|uniref:hypothetical protein n=1 Tax=Catenovulum sp. 2E275 TaxID=2980497 RepID=UPI0021D11BC2|nr:hypothetical protein [Catenovulum sp. 2E275]MCU4675133.1 hypothetical protein [Catenovulum sp. 2E275]
MLNTPFMLSKNSLIGLAQQVFCARLNKAERGVLLMAKLMLLNSLIMLSGGADSLVSLETGLLDQSFYDPLFYNYSEFLADPNLASQLFFGLICITFVLVFRKRLGLFLNKAAFTFRQNPINQPVHHAHGCRAPPAFLVVCN